MFPRMQTHSQSVLTADIQSKEQRKLHAKDPCGFMCRNTGSRNSFLILLDLFKTQTMKNVKKRRFLANLEVDPEKNPKHVLPKPFLYEIFSFFLQLQDNSTTYLYLKWTQQPQHNSSVTVVTDTTGLLMYIVEYDYTAFSTLYFVLGNL